MFGGAVDFWDVVAASIVGYIFGWLWHGPLFGKMWMKLARVSAADVAKTKKKKMNGKLILTFVGIFVMAYVFARLGQAAGAVTAMQGAILGFWIWLGFFAATTLLGSVLWEGKSWDFFVFKGLYWLVYLMMMGALLVAWS